jgi:hypothetical protein
LNTPLDSVAGARQAVTVILPVRLAADPGWPEGPMPFELGERRTDVGTRERYFTPAAARVLYGAPGRPYRWHQVADVTHGPMRLHGMELLRTGTDRDAERALAVLHFMVEGPHLLEVLRAIGHRHTAGPDPLSGPLAPETLLGGVVDAVSPQAPFALARPYTVAFMTPAEGDGVPDEWLWALASRSSPVDFPVRAEDLPGMLSDVVRISADWSALVLRHGAAYVGHRPDRGDGDFYDFAALHARTVYLDALLLGTVQRDHINELADDLSEVFEGDTGLARRVAALEERIARFRSTYWRQHLTAHGPANELLVAYQALHRLPARFEAILAEAADYARLVQTQESQQISGALGVLTVLGLPLGTALSILQVLGDQSPWHLLVALAAAFAATGAALTTRYGRLVLASLRGSGRRVRRGGGG